MLGTVLSSLHILTHLIVTIYEVGAIIIPFTHKGTEAQKVR